MVKKSIEEIQARPNGPNNKRGNSRRTRVYGDENEPATPTTTRKRNKQRRKKYEELQTLDRHPFHAIHQSLSATCNLRHLVSGSHWVSGPRSFLLTKKAARPLSLHGCHVSDPANHAPYLVVVLTASKPMWRVRQNRRSGLRTGQIVIRRWTVRWEERRQGKIIMGVCARRPGRKVKTFITVYF